MEYYYFVTFFSHQKGSIKYFHLLKLKSAFFDWSIARGILSSFNQWGKKIHIKGKVIYAKYSKHWLSTVANTIDCVCSKMLNNGLNHGLFLSLLKLVPCPIHWIVYVLAYWNFIFEFYSSFSATRNGRLCQTHKSMSFIWIVWSTLYVYL